MLKSKRAGSDSAFVEYSTITQVNGCSGPNRNAIRHRIDRAGRVESWVYRSPRESGDPIGQYRGWIQDKEWKSLLRTFSAMRWTENPSGPPGPPGPPLPPGPTEAISVLTLSDGRNTADFGLSGPAPDPISDAFSLPGILARRERDTLWQLALVNPRAEIRKDSLHFIAEWRWRGPAGARILFSRDAGGDFCGTARFKWFLDTSDYSVEWHEATWKPSEDGPLLWDFPGSKSYSLRIKFPYDGPKGTIKRVGFLDGIGIRLVPASSKDTVSATIFTDRFDF
jgi:hypothetical protein